MTNGDDNMSDTNCVVVKPMHGYPYSSFTNAANVSNAKPKHNCKGNHNALNRASQCLKPLFFRTML